jgi:opacity protein-like surface antigen
VALLLPTSVIGTSETTNFPNIPVLSSNSLSRTQAGWTVGAGWEYSFGNNWSGKIEYLHAEFDVSTNGTLDGFPSSHKIRVRTDIARVGLNYRFGGGRY